METSIYPKILIITTPIGEQPEIFPPYGSLSVITSLKKAGFHNTHLYNIDLLRPDYESALGHILNEKPDILGISSVVSTAYGYTQKIANDIKKRLPNTTIILGGNLGASAEIILKKTSVEFICTGEGERTSVDFVSRWLQTKNRMDFASIPGLAFLDNQGELFLTPYVDPIPAEEVYDIDWSILEDLGHMSHFIPPALGEGSWFFNFTNYTGPMGREPYRKDKTFFMVVASKGCVARCTFCHRWDAGIRYIPVSVVMERIDRLIEKYNLGFVSFGDENFGSDRKWVAELARELKKRDLIWLVGGMRVSTITFEMMKMMKDAGCVSIFAGIESGSQKILDVMEKKTTVEQNRAVMKWNAELGLNGQIVLVLGMPGETPETVRETKEYLAYCAQINRDMNPNHLCVNFAQALPGTPLYEIGRAQGAIGQDIDGEEEYLINISDRAAQDGETTINFTDYPRMFLEFWDFEIRNGVRLAYIEKWGVDAYYDVASKAPNLEFIRGLKAGRAPTFGALLKQFIQEKLKNKFKRADSPKGDGTLKSHKELYRLKIGHFVIFFPALFSQNEFLMKTFVFANVFRKYGFLMTACLTYELIGWKVARRLSFLKFKSAHKLKIEYISLRKFVKKDEVQERLLDNPMMAALRKGR